MSDATHHASDSAQLLGGYAKQNVAHPAISHTSLSMNEPLPTPASTPSLEKRNATTSNHIEKRRLCCPWCHGLHHSRYKQGHLPDEQ